MDVPTPVPHQRRCATPRSSPYLHSQTYLLDQQQRPSPTRLKPHGVILIPMILALCGLPIPDPLSGTLASTTDTVGGGQATTSSTEHTSTSSSKESAPTAKPSTPPPAENPQTFGYAVNGTASDSTEPSQAQYVQRKGIRQVHTVSPNPVDVTEQSAIPPQPAAIGPPLSKRGSGVDLEADSLGGTLVERVPSMVERHAQQLPESMLLPGAGTQGQVDPMAAKKPAERRVRIATTEQPSHLHPPGTGRRIDKIRAHVPASVLKGLLGRDVAPYAIRRLRQRASSTW